MMMRGVTVELPPLALAKLQELELARAACEDAGRAAANRLAALPVDADASLRERWSVERDKQNRRHSDLSRLCNSVRQWLFQQRLPLALAQPVELELKNGVSLPAAIESARNDIRAVQQELAKVRSAVLPRKNQEAAVSAYLARLAAAQRLQIVFDVHGNASVRWADDVIAGKDDILSLLAFVLGPQQLVAAFSASLAQQQPEATALAPEEKAKRISELSARLSSLGYLEQGLIDRCAVQGIMIDSRPDADPACVLGVVIAKTTAAAA
jgi:hypothetical protein